MYPSISFTIFFFMLPPPPRSPLFPYTTLFRSRRGARPSPRRSVQARGRLAGAHRGSRTLPGWRPIELEGALRSEEHTSELQSHSDLVCRLLLEKKKKK